ncbi:hypothetical protein Q7C18_16590 [Nesterenkonia sp. CL21]|uniref:hypothetical protein n=1 Tax=Nesterenkonia sp. CL21 TaxID=3064894 RepID=UPI002879AD74|nr:hypothetical protein [Nesterenkonia sp. CL21]MDS2174321.1 hypothetical protein [Nesterenkonia sp. CL21]
MSSGSTGSTCSAGGAVPAPRWAVWAAWGTVLTTLPSGLWRLGNALGLPWGYASARWDQDRPALIALSLLTTATAALSLGLVRSWGQTVPGWVPQLGGRVVPVRPVVVVASIGAVLLTLLWAQLFWWWAVEPLSSGVDPRWHTAVGFLYLPLVAWGPLLAAVTWDYRRRRRASESV